MRNFVQAGDNITIPAPATVASGAGVLVGSLFGVANGDAPVGESVVISTRGVFDLPKEATDAIGIGDEVFWDDTNDVVTVTDTGNFIGHAVAIAGNPSSTARVRLGQ